MESSNHALKITRICGIAIEQARSGAAEPMASGQIAGLGEKGTPETGVPGETEEVVGGEVNLLDLGFCFCFRRLSWGLWS